MKIVFSSFIQQRIKVQRNRFIPTGRNKWEEKLAGVLLSSTEVNNGEFFSLDALLKLIHPKQTTFFKIINRLQTSPTDSIPCSQLSLDDLTQFLTTFLIDTLHHYKNIVTAQT